VSGVSCQTSAHSLLHQMLRRCIVSFYLVVRGVVAAIDPLCCSTDKNTTLDFHYFMIIQNGIVASAAQVRIAMETETNAARTKDTMLAC